MKFDIVDFVSKLVAFKSVSADSSYSGEVRKCAEFLAGALENFGFSARLRETALNPIIFAERPSCVQPPKLRVLCYGHYDVQPVDPIEKWKTPPFEATLVGGRLMGRGTADNKGPFSCLLGGLLGFLEKNPDAPIDFGIMLEGEEEIGSPSMAKFVSEYAEKISGYDMLLLSDTSAASPDTPIITIGLRGTGSFDAVFKGPKTDVHSGMFGGIVRNPIQAMFEVCASLHDADGFVNIPHFYDGLEKLADWERAEIAKNPFGEREAMELLGVKALYRQKGYSPSEAVRVLPTVEITGAGGGYQGEGSKSVIASECFCKFCCRTVAPQKTAEVIELVKKTIAGRAPAGIEVSFIDYDSYGDAYFINPRALDLSTRKGAAISRAFAASAKASRGSFGNEPILLREGASIPLISLIKRETGLDSFMFGLFTAADNLHAPNEGFSIKTMQTAQKYYELFFANILD